MMGKATMPTDNSSAESTNTKVLGVPRLSGECQGVSVWSLDYRAFAGVVLICSVQRRTVG